MRRTLFLVSAVAAATASSFAATSSNIVGYVKLSLSNGFSLIANQLDNGTGNKVTDLFAGSPDGLTVYKYTGAGFNSISYVDGAWEGTDTAMTAAPGEGVFVLSPSATAVTFVGEVKTGTSTVTLRAGGFSIVSSVIPQQLVLDAASGFPVGEGDTVYRFTGAGYLSDSFTDGAWEGPAGGPPTVKVGEAFYVLNAGGAETWTRTFTVN